MTFDVFFFQGKTVFERVQLWKRLSDPRPRDGELGTSGNLGYAMLGMCYYSLRSPTPLYYILWPVLEPLDCNLAIF